jgi:negative regulator of replication initiation
MDDTGYVDTDFFVLLLESRASFEQRFGERAADVLRRIADVVSRERPCHIAFTIRFDTSG